MTLAKLFQNGRSQAVRLPKDFRFNINVHEVIVKKIGTAIVLIPKSELKNFWIQSLSKFPADFSIERDTREKQREIDL
jgi:antitoxin VapB